MDRPALSALNRGVQNLDSIIRQQSRSEKGVVCLRGGWARRLAGVILALVLCTAMAGAVNMERKLVPVGHTVGVKLFARGVMVVRPPEDGTPAQTCGLEAGDVIVRCGGTAVTSTEQFQSLLQQGGDTELEVNRNGGDVKLSVEPERNAAGEYQIGAWIRDSMAGIGTMTWYDPEDGTFGALGHGITDVDTALLMPFSQGSILFSTVKAVKRGEAGSAGELRGDFDLTGSLGTLYANTDRGVFGRLDDGAVSTLEMSEALPLGTPEDGRGVILANVRRGDVAAYAVEVETARDGQDMLLHVTDPALLEATGGIVQGMSGSPVLQNGKLVGAVTHVLLRDPSRGYGISIEKMLEAA